MKRTSIKRLLLLLLIICMITVPIYGQASNLQKRGNIKGTEEDIRNMKEDFYFLESEIDKLLDECKENLNYG